MVHYQRNMILATQLKIFPGSRLGFPHSTVKFTWHATYISPRIKAIDTSATFEDQAEAFFQYADTYYNDTYDGEYYRMMVKPVIVLIREVSNC